MGDLINLPVAPRERLRELHRYGSAAGLDVALMLNTDEGAHLPLRLTATGPDPIGTATLASFQARALYWRGTASNACRSAAELQPPAIV